MSTRWRAGRKGEAPAENHTGVAPESKGYAATSPAREPEDDEEDELQAALPEMVYPHRVQLVIDAVLRAVQMVDGAEVRAFGSSVNGFGEAASDVDLVLAATKASLAKGLELGKVSKRDLAPRSLGALQKYLRREGFRISERVLGAKVPILKMKFRDMDCDLSLNNLLPVFNTLLLKTYADLDRRVVDIARTFKQWAKDNEVHGAPYGHLSSYAFTLLSIFYMQVRGALPCLQCMAEASPEIYEENGRRFNVAMQTADHRKQHNAANGTEISFDGLVRFYHAEFQWGEWVVSVRKGYCLEVDQYPTLKMKPRDGVSKAEWAEVLHIEDPFDVQRNLNCVLNVGSNAKLWWALDSTFQALGSKTECVGARRVWRGRREGRMGPRTS
eukprot:TRINITY_DN38994_c0_g1_i1.p1 TRINITY_DN38994_c0_g1~~TRINITY_DN38994_c0_g1_i1.p1  ORF type:complete len:394 (-),score=69.01 TRINITY_DN38994_c0_g1_i1:19-1173(-)